MFQTILVTPMLNALMWLYDVLPGRDLGVAIILLTLIIKGILYIPSISSIRAQHKLQDLQPKVDAVRKKYASNKEEMSRKLMEVYKENKVNPFSSCLPLLIQLPIIYALFRVFLVIKTIDPGTGLLAPDQLAHLYGPLHDKFMALRVSTKFLGFMDLAATKNYVLAVLAGVFSFWQVRMMQSQKPAIKSEGSRDESMAAMMNKQTTYILPAITVLFGISLPAGITLYWVVSTLFTVGQQALIIKRHKHPGAGEVLPPEPKEPKEPKKELPEKTV